MSLATRCTSCGTVFRVVQDQLKVSEGWVRCGRCDEIFNALEGLFDLERDAPPDWSPLAGQEAIRIARNANSPAQPDSQQAQGPVIAHGGPPGMGMQRSASAPAHDDPELSSPVDESQASGDWGAARPGPGAELSDAGAEPAAVEGEPATTPAPNFLRDTNRRSHWDGSPTRAFASSAVVSLLLLGLLGQAILHFRDGAAARWPAARPALAAGCNLLGCAIDPVRRIEDISVENTALTRAVQPDSFGLAVRLRNRGATVLAMPAVELSLTDSSGQLLVRKVLAPSDFQAVSTTMEPGAEATLQLTLAAGSSRVTGYTVEIFYP